MEVRRCLDPHHLVGDAAQPLGRLGRAHGDCEQQAARVQRPQPAQCRFGGDAGGQTVIHDDHVVALEIRKRSVAPIPAHAALELAALLRHQPIECVARHTERPQRSIVDDGGTTFRHRPDPELHPARRTNLARDEHLDRSIQRRRDRHGDGHATPRQGHHERRVELASGQDGTELPTGVRSVAKPHRALRCRDRDRRCTPPPSRDRLRDGRTHLPNENTRRRYDLQSQLHRVQPAVSVASDARHPTALSP